MEEEIAFPYYLGFEKVRIKDSTKKT